MYKLLQENHIKILGNWESDRMVPHYHQQVIRDTELVLGIPFYNPITLVGRYTTNPTLLGRLVKSYNKKVNKKIRNETVSKDIKVE